MVLASVLHKKMSPRKIILWGYDLIHKNKLPKKELFFFLQESMFQYLVEEILT